MMLSQFCARTRVIDIVISNVIFPSKRIPINPTEKYTDIINIFCLLFYVFLFNQGYTSKDQGDHRAGIAQPLTQPGCIDKGAGYSDEPSLN